MKRIMFAALLLGSAVAVTSAANAQTGFLCGFASITDPTVEGDVQTGEIHGGPLFAADTDNPGEETANISIRCTIQVGAQGETHAGTDSYTAESSTGPGVAVLPVHQFSYVSPEGAPVYLCTEAEVNGQIRYWDSENDPDDPNDGGWQLSNTHDCSLAINQEGPDAPVGPTDSVVMFAPPDGSEPIHFNVDGWDCSSYTWNAGTREYEVTCFFEGALRAAATCGVVRVSAIGVPFTVVGATWCDGGGVATAVSNGVGAALGGVSPWHCHAVFLLPTGFVECNVTTA